MKYLKISSRLVCSLLLATFLISSCSDSQVTEPTRNESENPLIKFLVEQGFREDMIIDKGDSYLVEEDISISKKSIRNAIEKLESTKSDTTDEVKQAYDTGFGVVDRNEIDNIKVMVHSSLSGTAWETEIRDAIDNWNDDIVHTLVQFEEIETGNADIIIYDDNSNDTPTNCQISGNGTIGMADFPENGEPGNCVGVNLNFNQGSGFNGSATDGEMEFTVVHELGHTIGFRHTNFRNVDPLGSRSSAEDITCTPSSDQNSVMNGGSINEWTAFSSFDKKATQVLYSEQLFTPSLSVYQQASGFGNTVYIYTNINVPFDNSVSTSIYKSKNGGPFEFHRSLQCGATSPSPDIVQKPYSGSDTYTYKAKATYFGGIQTSFSRSISITVYSSSGGGGF